MLRLLRPQFSKLICVNFFVVLHARAQLLNLVIHPVPLVGHLTPHSCVRKQSQDRNARANVSMHIILNKSTCLSSHFTTTLNVNAHPYLGQLPHSVEVLLDGVELFVQVFIVGHEFYLRLHSSLQGVQAGTSGGELAGALAGGCGGKGLGLALGLVAAALKGRTASCLIKANTMREGELSTNPILTYEISNRTGLMTHWCLWFCSVW